MSGTLERPARTHVVDAVVRSVDERQGRVLALLARKNDGTGLTRRQVAQWMRWPADSAEAVLDAMLRAGKIAASDAPEPLYTVLGV